MAKFGGGERSNSKSFGVSALSATDDAGEDEVEGQGYQDDGTAVPVALVAQLEKRAEAADATVLTFPLRRRANLWSNCGSCF